MIWVYDDGGRELAGFKGNAGDCATRAIAIATGASYLEVYEALQARQTAYILTRRTRTARRMRGQQRGSWSVRQGTLGSVVKPYLRELGWEWHATMAIGSGTRVHLHADELPAGTLIARVSKHFVAVVDSVVRDTHDPSRDGTRAVYGYWMPPGA